MRMRAPLLILIASLTLVSAPATAQQDDRKPDRPPTSGLLEQADLIAREVAVIRGLGLVEPLNKGVKTRDELHAELIARIDRDYSAEEIEAEARVYKTLGLLPEELDYKQLVLDLFTEQIAGFYDQEVGELYIMAGLPQALQRPTMAHEIFHALQDQHFDIGALQAPFSSKENGDFSLARSALLEGDATALMIDFTLREQGQLPLRDGEGRVTATTLAQMPGVVGLVGNMTLENLSALESMSGDVASGEKGASAMEKAPAVIRESMLFPYLGGLRFVVMAFHRLGSWEKVNEIYAAAPVSTEQIIHPERYFAGDEPVLLESKPEQGFGAGWSRTYDNVAGEFQMHLTLRHHLRLERPKGAPLFDVDINRAVEGWGGDRLMGFEGPDGQFAVVHLSAWDTVEDAREYHAALLAAVETRHHGGALRKQTSAAGHGQAACYTLGEGSARQRVYVEQWGDMVLHIEGIGHVEMPKGKQREAPVFRVRDATFDTLARVPFAEEVARRAREAAEGDGERR